MLYNSPVPTPPILVPVTKQRISDVLAALVDYYGDETRAFTETGIDLIAITAIKTYTKRVESLALAGQLPISGNTFSNVTLAEATNEYAAMRVYCDAPDNNWYKSLYTAIVAANPTWNP